MMGILVVAGTRTPATAVWILVIPVLAVALPTAPAKNAAMMAVGGVVESVMGTLGVIVEAVSVTSKRVMTGITVMRIGQMVVKPTN